MKKLIIIAVVLWPFVSLAAKVKCKVVVTSPDSVKPIELIIIKSGVDTRYSDDFIKTSLEDGRFECEIEADEIQLYNIVDEGELKEKGRTARWADFFVEDGATVSLALSGNRITATSTGKEFNAWNDVSRLRNEVFTDEIAAIEAKGDDVPDEKMRDLKSRMDEWSMEYYQTNPTLGFLIQLETDLASFNFFDKGLGRRLDIYHACYEDLYPGHSSHRNIAAHEGKGYEIFGRPFNDFNLRSLDGEVVNTGTYRAGRPTLIVCWATWCLSCREDAVGMVDLYEKYRDKGLNVFSIAREFENTAAVRKVVADDNYPWPCLLDLDDEFKVFEKLGMSSGGMFLVNAEGRIVAVGYDAEELAPAVEDLLK